MLVRLEDADFKDRVQQAQAQLEQAKATLEQNRAKIGLRPGQKFSPENVSEVRAARAALDLADKNLRRYEKLVESGDISRATYDQQVSQRDQAAEQYQALIHQAQQNYATVANSQAAVDAAQTNLSLAKRSLTYTTVTGSSGRRRRIHLATAEGGDDRQSESPAGAHRCSRAVDTAGTPGRKCFGGRVGVSGSKFLRPRRARVSERDCDVAHADCGS